MPSKKALWEANYIINITISFSLITFNRIGGTHVGRKLRDHGCLGANEVVERVPQVVGAVDRSVEFPRCVLIFILKM